MRNAVDQMEKDLDTPEQISQMTPSQNIEAHNYVKLLNDAIKVLEGPNAQDYVNNKYAAKGKTVGELVKNMAGLKFAPATPGSERAYKALQEALAKYYRNSSGQSSASRGDSQ